MRTISKRPMGQTYSSLILLYKSDGKLIMQCQCRSYQGVQVAQHTRTPLKIKKFEIPYLLDVKKISNVFKILYNFI